MFPPIDPAVLHANPQFAALYSDLTTNRLHQADVSTVNRDREARWMDAWNTSAHYKHQPAKLHLLRNALLTLAHRVPPCSAPAIPSTSPSPPSPSPSDSAVPLVGSPPPTRSTALPDELQTAISVLMTPISDPILRSQALSLLKSDAEYFLSNLPVVVSALVAYFDQSTPHIAALLHHRTPQDLGIQTTPSIPRSSSIPPASQRAQSRARGIQPNHNHNSSDGTPNPPPVETPLPPLNPSLVAEILSSPPSNFHTLSNPHSLPSTDPYTGSLTIPSAPASLRAAHSDLVVELIKILEQAVHGTIAHHDKSKAKHLAVLARAIELKADLQLASLAETELVIQKAVDKELATGGKKNDPAEDVVDGYFPFASPEKGRSTKMNREGPMARLGKALGEYIRHLELSTDRSDIHT